MRDNHQIIEQKFNFLDHGGYSIEIHFSYENKVAWFLNKIGVVRPQNPIVELGSELGWDFISMQGPEQLKTKGTFLTSRGIKTLRLKFKKFTIANFTAHISINRLSN